MTRIRIGQIGVCHEHAAATMRSLRKLGEVFEVVGVVDDSDSPAPRRGVADLAAYDGLPWLSESELLATPGLQAVAVETANHDLVPTAMRCVQHGLAVRMDKPGGEDAAAFAALIEAVARQRIPFQIGYMFRANRAMRWCIEAAAKGWFGEVFQLEAGMSHDYGDEAYRRYLGAFAGGIMFNLGCHLIDLAISVLGRPERVTPVLKSLGPDAAGPKDLTIAILEYPRAWASVRCCSAEPGGLARRSLTLCGTRGTFELRPLERFDGQELTAEVVFAQPNEAYAAGAHRIAFGAKDDRYADHLLEFAGMIAGTVGRVPSLEHELAVHAVVLAASGVEEESICERW